MKVQPNPRLDPQVSRIALGSKDDIDGDSLGEPHEFMVTVDALVIGRKTFETVLAFYAWPYVVADRAEST